MRTVLLNEVIIVNRFKKIIAVASAFAIAFSLAACNGKNEDPTVSVKETATYEETTTESVAETLPTMPETVTQTETVPFVSEPASEAVTAAVNVTQVTEITTAPPEISVPSNKADIVGLYNLATQTAQKNTPAYSKTVNTTLSDFDMGALSRFDFIRGVIGDFLGEGKRDTSVNKGNFDGQSLVISTLSASDVTSAACTLSPDGKYYIVKITVKNETNPVKGNSALGRFTRDYKDANEIEAGLEDVGASVGGMSVKTSSVTIEAKISVDGTKFESLKHSFKMSADMTNVKYSFVRVNNASAKLSTTVTYSSFRY